MFILKGKRIVLRDFIKEDIEDYVKWNTTCREWMLWDAPWEFDEDEIFDEEKFRQKKLEWIKQPKKPIRTRLEICLNNEEKTHIGWVSCYLIDEQFHYTDQDGKCAIGIDIPDPNYRSKGYGKDAYLLFIHYLKVKGIEEIYTQTWSGNHPMINLAKSVGFEECNRYCEYRIVRGETYDGLTFKLIK
jgi:RimJ/RimL family protein N-acetyltransferase